LIRFPVILLPLVAAAHAHFEARHLHPVDITPDGARVLAVNAPGGFLSVFTPGTEAQPTPVLTAEIPVGLEPVTVRARNANEAWVVNEVSDSISVVDLARRTVVRTLAVPDEPADVVFHGGRAFVSCGRANRIAVFDTATFAEVASIPLEGNFVRALALSPDGSKLRAAFLLSGNNSTVLHFRRAPAQPSPADPALPAAPRTALIVADTDPRIPYDVLDHDVAEIDTATLQVTGYRSGLGTNLFALAHSSDGALWAAASEARNLIRFEPALNGVFAESRVARVPAAAAAAIVDLNPQAESPVVGESTKALALAQPMALLPSGGGMWLAAFGSDRLAELDAAGQVLRRIDLRSAGSESLVRGPRGIARHASLGRLFVLNKLSGSLSAIDEESGVLRAEVPLAAIDPLPPEEKLGRGFFFDARRSGNGTVACGSCHFDADNDGLAWDLGDPSGVMIELIERHLAFGETAPIPVPAHPMKGPMVTQSLRGIGGAAPFHWRGDMQRIQDFNPTFAKLQAGSELAAADMDKVAAYLESLANHPNPNRNLDDTLKTSLAGGNPVNGRVLFHRFETCSKCHPEPRGTNHNLDDHQVVLTTQTVKNSTLEHVYRKVGFTPDQAVSALGFGFTHDGSGHDVPRGHEYDLDNFHRTPGAEADVMAYILSAGTGTAPAVGRSVTVRRGDADPAERAMLESQAAVGKCDLVLRGTRGGEAAAFLYQPAGGDWRPADGGPALPFTAVLAGLASGDALTLMGVPAGKGPRLAIDRDANGVPDDAEARPRLDLELSPMRLRWPAGTPGWVAEHSADLRDWRPCPAPTAPDESGLFVIEPPPPGPFFRLRRTW
jgi:DNA-binding beta-propeller fold protein YncE